MPVSPSLVRRSWQPIEFGLVPQGRPSLRIQIVFGPDYTLKNSCRNQHRILSRSALQNGGGDGNGGTPTGKFKWIGEGDDDEGNHRPGIRIYWWMAFSILLTV
jgi:hypothetical protein